MPLFDSEFLKRLEYLSLVSRRVFRGKLLAQRRVKQLGSGIEFADHRDYSPGDDLRYLDWNIYARHGDLLLKRFQEEEDLHVYLLLDVSRSMSSGSGDKFDYARRVAAALAYIALADLDRVSILAYADEVIDILPLIRGKDRILTLLRFLEALQPSGAGTRLNHVARSLVQRAQRTGLVVILSDFYDQEGFRQGVDLLRYRRFEPHLIQLHTTAEANPTWLGDIELEEVETGARRKITITERKLRQYKTVFAAFLNSIDTYCRTYSLSCTRTTTDIPFDELLLRMMRATVVTS
jgi:uncharacterized protein (DUF58 family)